jgi:hypothetical protein
VCSKKNTDTTTNLLDTNDIAESIRNAQSSDLSSKVSSSISMKDIENSISSQVGPVAAQRVSNHSLQSSSRSAV